MWEENWTCSGLALVVKTFPKDEVEFIVYTQKSLTWCYVLSRSVLFELRDQENTRVEDVKRRYMYEKETGRSSAGSWRFKRKYNTMKPSTQDFQQWMAGMNMTCRFTVDSLPEDLATNQLATNCVVYTGSKSSTPDVTIQWSIGVTVWDLLVS